MKNEVYILIIVIGIVLVISFVAYMYTKNNPKNNPKPDFSITNDPKPDFSPNIITNSVGIKFDTNYHGNDPSLTASTNYPGPSFWSKNNAFIGSDGELHLKYQKNSSGVWESAEAVCLDPINYGDYYFTVHFVDGVGAYDSPADWNTTFGAYTFYKAGLTTPGLCGNYCSPSSINPNGCHELDIVEWGKSRVKDNFGMAQWGTQPWFNFNPNNPNDPSNCQFNPTNLARSMWDLNRNNKWSEIGKAGNSITFRMNWMNNNNDPSKKKNLQFWAAAGDFGPQPWNKGFNDQNFDNSTSTNAWSFNYYIEGNPNNNNGNESNIPIVDGDTYLHFNLWAPGGQGGGPSDGKEKEVIIKNICVPKDGIPHTKMISNVQDFNIESQSSNATNDLVIDKSRDTYYVFTMTTPLSPYFNFNINHTGLFYKIIKDSFVYNNKLLYRTIRFQAYSNHCERGILCINSLSFLCYNDEFFGTSLATNKGNHDLTVLDVDMKTIFNPDFSIDNFNKNFSLAVDFQNQTENGCQCKIFAYTDGCCLKIWASLIP